MNKERLLKVRDQILAESHHFDMDGWFTSHGDEGGLMADLKTHAITEDKEKTFTCGTTCCIAGHAVVLSLREGLKHNRAWIHDAAADYLELSAYSASLVFYVSLWPQLFKSLYKNARCSVDRAKVAAAYIDWLVTHEQT